MSEHRYPYDIAVNGIVGHSRPVRDAVLKVTGELKYTDDMFPERMLCGKVLQSPVAHAIIKSIDTSRAEALKGVRAVVTYKDAPKRRFNGNGEDRNDFPSELVFEDRVRYVGDRVAAVAADTAEIADEALKLIEVEYEELPHYLTPEESLAEDAVRIHEGGNTLAEVNSSCGDVEDAMAGAYKVYERTFKVPAIYHCPMEPHVCIASYDRSGKLTIITPTQDPFGQRENLQRIFGLPMNKIRVVNPGMGGGFGGKIDLILEHMAAMLAMKTFRPVKMVYSRKEDMLGGRTRHAMTVKNRIGVDKDGTIVAVDMDALVNAGAHTGCTMSVTWAMCGKIFKNLKCPNIRFHALPVYTNTIPAGAMRGFGSPQAFIGEQCMMNTIAKDLGIDIFEMQMKNVVEPHDIDHTDGSDIGNSRLRDCLNKGRELIGYDEAVKEMEASKVDGGRYRIGVGIGAGAHGTSMYGICADTTGVSIKMNDDGTATLMTGVSDMGNGSTTTQQMVAAEILGMDPSHIEVVMTDTDVVLNDLGSYASRGTFVGSGAALKVAKQVRKILLEEAGKLLEVDPKDLVLKDEKAVLRDEAASASGSVKKEATLHEVMDYARNTSQRDIEVADTFATYDGPFVYGAHFVKVRVDTETGKVEPLDYVSVHDIGYAINPGNLEGQMHGGIHMGLGYALSEAVQLDESGRFTNNNLNKYHIFRAKEMPRIQTFMVEEIESSGPFGAKSIGECAVVPSAPAIVNAVSNAIDRELFELPLTPERVLAAIREG